MADSKLKKTNVAADVLKRTAGLVGGAVADYFKGAMPTTTSTISEATKAATKLTTTMGTKSRNVVSTVRSLNIQGGLKKIYNWYMDKEDEYSLDFDFDSSLDFDIDLSNNDNQLEIAEISETAASANQVSSSIIESAHKMLEGQVQVTANILNRLDHQTAVIATGFDNLSAKLNDLIEIYTKNSAVLIETTMGASDRFDTKKQSAGEDILLNGFDPAKMAKLISENLDSDMTFGMVKAFAPVLFNKNMIKMMASPDELARMVITPIMDRLLPGLTEGLKTMDKTLNETIVTSLVSLGAEKSWGFGGGDLKDIASRLLGIDASRREVSGSKASLDLKATAFDTLTRESIVNVIPNYLSKILEALGEEREVYDYKSRSFKSQNAIRNEFMDASTTRGAIHSASKNVANAIGRDDFGSMVYDLMMTDLGNKFSGGESKNIVTSFADPAKFVEYVNKELFAKNGVTLGANELLRVEEMGRNVAAKDKEAIGKDIFMQSAKTNVQRGAKAKQYVNEAQRYETDLTGMRTSASDEMKHILSQNGRLNENSASIKPGGSQLRGVSYTNKALYEIYRVLNRGINVFQVGAANLRDKPFKERGDDYLPKPADHRPKSSTEQKLPTMGAPTGGLNIPSNDDEANLLQNQELEDGEMEELSAGERFGRWSKARGAGLMRAIVSGDQQAVRDEFGVILRDVTQVTGDAVKKSAEHINQQFGNVTGYLKHKFFGMGYSYQDGVDENGKPIMVHIADNEKGGVFGFVKDKAKSMFEGTKEKAKNWFQSVASYFDYGDPKSEKGDVMKKRRKLISASVGAMIGGGILGGPLGLIMGAVAGNAIGSVSNIGSKIKELLFGHDKNTGKGTGLFTKLSDAVILPIKFQIGKTISHLASNLKKNILGPLSDIGQAIKDRIASAADSTFGKAFKFISNVITAPFRGIGKALLGLVKLPATIMGGLTRTVSSLGTNLIGGALTTVAHTIASGQKHTYVDENGNEQTMSSRKNLYNRAKERRKEAKEEKKNSEYRSYKEWRNKQWQGRIENDRKLAEATAERRLTDEEYEDLQARKKEREEEKEARKAERDHNTQVLKQNEQMIETQEQNEENTSEMRQDLNQMSREALSVGSLYVHDQGVHNRLDNIIAMIKDYTGYEGPGPEEVVSESFYQEPETAEISTEVESEDKAKATEAGSNDLQEAISQLTAAVEENTGVVSDNTQTIDTVDQSIADDSSKEASKGIFGKIKGGLSKAGNWLAEDWKNTNVKLKDGISNGINSLLNSNFAKQFQSEDYKKMQQDKAEASLVGEGRSTANAEAENEREEMFNEMESNAQHTANENYAASALGAAASLASVGGLEDSTDQRIFGQIEAESRKDESNKSVIGAKIKELFNNQKEKSNEEEEDWFSKVLKFIAENPAILAIGAAAAALSKAIENIDEFLKSFSLPDISPLTELAENFVDNVAKAIKNAWNLITGGGDDDGEHHTPGLDGINAATGFLDMQVTKSSDWANPFGDINHIQKDAAGHHIVNQAATTAKNDFLFGSRLKTAGNEDWMTRIKKFTESKSLQPYLEEYNVLKAQNEQEIARVNELDENRKNARSKTEEMEHGEKRYKESSEQKLADAEEKYKARDEANAKIKDLDSEIEKLADEHPDRAAKIQERDNLKSQASALEAEGDDLLKRSLEDESTSQRFGNQRSKQGSLADELDYQHGKAVETQKIAGEKLNTFDTEHKVTERSQRIQGYDDELASNMKSGAKDIIHNTSKIGRDIIATEVASGAVAKGVSSAATALGLDEGTSEKIGHTAGTITGGAITINVMKSAAKGQASVIDKVCNGFKSLLNAIVKFCKADKLLSRFGNKLDDIAAKLFKGISSKIDDVIIARLDAALVKWGVKGGLTVVTAGAGYALGAVVGLIDGICGVEYLFQVLPGEADYMMTYIASVLKGVSGTVSMDPVIGWTIVLLETLDAIAQGIFDMGIYQFIAQGIYRLIAGDDGLNASQSKFKAEIKGYNEKYGAELDTGDFNDLVNNSGLLDVIIRGKIAKNEDGSLKFDKAGGRINTGIASIAVGGETDYMTDEEGNVIKDANGKAIEKKDKYGNTKKVDEKWGDRVGADIRGTGAFFGGRDIYKTDEEGNAMIDKNGQYIVESHEYGLFEDPSKAIGQMLEHIKNSFTDLDKKFSDAIEGGKAALGEIPGIIVDGRIGDLITLKVEAVEDNPFALVANGLLGVVKSVAGVPTLISGVVHGAIDTISGAANAFSEGFKNTADTIARFPGYLAGGQIKELIEDSGASKDPGAFGMIGTVVTNVAKMPFIIPTAISALGHIVGDFVNDKIVKPAKEFADLAVTEQKHSEDMLSSQDVSLSDYFNVPDKPDDPFNGIKKAITIAMRVITVPFAISKAVGRRIKDVFDKVKDTVTTGWNTVVQNHSMIDAQAKAGNPDGLMALTYESAPDNPLGGVTSAIFTIDKFLSWPRAVFHWVGNKVKEVFDTVKGALDRSWLTFTTNNDALKSAANSGDVDAVAAVEYQGDETNPLNGVMSGIFVVSKIIHYPIAVVHAIGNKIAEIFNAVVSTVSSAKATLDANNEELDSAANSGDVDAVAAVEYQGDETNPLNGVMSGIFVVSKIIHYPIAVVHAIGNKIAEIFNAVGNVIGKTKEDIDKNANSINSMADSGDIEGLSSLEFEQNEENPLGGIAVGISNVIKVFNYPRAAIKWAANKIKDAFESIGKTISSDKSALDAKIKEMEDNAKDGNVSKIWDAEFKPDKNDPLGGIFSASFVIAKLFNSAAGSVNAIFKGIGNIVEGIKDGLSGIAEDIFEGIKTFVNGGGPLDEISVPAYNPVAASRVGGPTNQSIGVPIPSAGGNPLDKPAMITSGYGKRKLPYEGDHKGIDITPANGDTDANVSSRYSGVVSYVKRSVSNDDRAKVDKNGKYQYSGSNSGGNQVWVDTDDGLRVKAMHLKGGSVPSSIKAGSRIEAGTPIGSMGSTGWSTGPHLHYQVEKMNKNKSFIPVNPVSTFMGGPTNAMTKVVNKVNRIGDDAEYTRWLDIIKSVKQQIAVAKKGYSYGGNIMNTTFDGFTCKYRTDCSGFVSHCLSHLGKKNVSVTSSTLLSTNTTMENLGFDKHSWPGWDKLLPGDIVSKSGHTEIYAGKQDGRYKVWNCGSNESCNNSGATDKSNESYTVIWRLKAAPSNASTELNDDISNAAITSTNSSSNTASGGKAAQLASALNNLGQDFLSLITGGVISKSSEQKNDANLSESGNSVYNGDSDKATIFKYLKGMGISDAGAAGAMGCWESESGNHPGTLEGHYLNESRAKTAADSTANLNSWTTEVLFPAYARSGISIKKNAYKGTDGNYYPGFGLAQWTGPRGYNVLKYAKDKGKDWKELDTQLDFVKGELENHSEVYSYLKSATNAEDAATYFLDHFEMYPGFSSNKPKWNQQRRNHAKNIFSNISSLKSESTGGETAISDWPHFKQGDPRWGKKGYSHGTFSGSGCGPTSFAMAMSGLNGKEIYPDTLPELSKSNYGTEGDSSFSSVPSQYGATMNFGSRGTGQGAKLRSELEAGHVAVTSGQPRSGSRGVAHPFTGAGHFVMVYGHDKDNYFINDPAGNKHEYPMSSFDKNFHSLFTFSKPGQVVKTVVKSGGPTSEIKVPAMNLPSMDDAINNIGGPEDDAVISENQSNGIYKMLKDESGNSYEFEKEDKMISGDLVGEKATGGPTTKGPSIFNNRNKTATSTISSIDNFVSRNTRKKEVEEKPVISIEPVQPIFSKTSVASYKSETPVVNVDTEGLQMRMDKIITYLEAIVSNTGLSSDLLGSMNEKGFVDKGLRDSLNALSRAKKPTSTYKYKGSGASSKSIANMARP